MILAIKKSSNSSITITVDSLATFRRGAVEQLALEKWVRANDHLFPRDLLADDAWPTDIWLHDARTTRWGGFLSTEAQRAHGRRESAKAIRRTRSKN